MLTQTRKTSAMRRGILGAAAAFVVAAGMGLATPASADQLDDLRASGAVGEAYDGFARARNGSVKSFVQDVNSKRRKIYISRAKQQGVSVDQVGRVYATQIIKKAPSGTWILSESGSWSQK